MYCLVLPWYILKWTRFLFMLVVSVDSVETPGMLLLHCTLLIWFHLSNWYPAAKCDHDISVMFILMITKSLIRWRNKFLILFHVNQMLFNWFYEISWIVLWHWHSYIWNSSSGQFLVTTKKGFFYWVGGGGAHCSNFSLECFWRKAKAP